MSGFLILQNKNRTKDHQVTITDANAAAIVLQADDAVRFKIGRGTGTPSFDLDSKNATANGSTITFTAGKNVATVRIAQDDLTDLEPGAYDCEVAVVDNSETAPANAIKTADAQGTFVLLRTQGGDVDVPT